MTNLFDESSSSDIFESTATATQQEPTYDVESVMEQLIAAGYSAEESAAAVLRYIEEQKGSQASVQGSGMNLHTDKQKAEYMRQIRTQVAPTIWIPPQMREQHASEQRIEQAQQEFVQRMKERASAGGMMRSNQAAIDFFRKP